jgi:transmembrane sensor
MTDGSKISDDARAAEDAAGWFARLQGEAATGEDWLAFERWLAASPAHARAYEDLERLWVELDHVEITRDLGAPPQPARRPLPRRAEGGRMVSRRAWIGAGAAVAAGLAVVAVGAGFWPSAGDAGQVYRTAPGQTRTIILADGTHIRLNAASQITVSFGRDARRVQMADAEAVFEVAHDAARPFLIAVGDRQVRVVGTEFNLRHRDGRVALTVRRGVVEVRPGDALQAQPIRVTVGQQLTHEEGRPLQTLALADGEAAFAWTNGQLIYRDRPLSEVAGDLSRRFAVPVRAADPETASMRFTGVLVTDREADVLRRLEAFAPIRVEHAGGAVILRRKG